MNVRLAIAVLLLSSCGGVGSGAPEASEDLTTCRTVECVVDEGLGVAAELGIEVAIERVVDRSNEISPDREGLCHDALHRLGQALGEYGETVVPSGALVRCSGGFVHGLFVGYGTSKGGLAQMVRTCEGYIDEESLLCRHGYGHAVADTMQRISGIQEACEIIAQVDVEAQIPEISIGQLCADGAFMEIAAQIRAGKWSEAVGHAVDECAGLGEETAWGCWRQLPSVSTEESYIKRVARTCDALASPLAEACATGIAIAEATTTTPPVRSWCSYLAATRSVCEQRLLGQRGR